MSRTSARVRLPSITLYQREGSENWWFDFRHGGRRIRRSAGTVDRREAEATARQYREDVVNATGRPARREGDDLALLAGLDVSAASARGVGARQLQSIEACWGHVCRVLGADTDPGAVTYDLVTAYVATRRNEGVRGQSIRKETQALKRGLKIARRRGSIAELPVEWPEVRSDPPRKWQRGKLHPPEVVQRWLEALAAAHPDAHRQAQVALRTGLRAEELRALTWEWVEQAPAAAGVPALLRVPAEAAKTRRERIVGLPAACLAHLSAAHDTQNAWDAPLFATNHRKAFDAARKTIGYRKTITLRDLRHCHATWAAQGTGDAAAAQAALGHTDLRTTQRYLSTTISRTASAAVAVGDVVDADRALGPVTGPLGTVGHSGRSQQGQNRGNEKGPTAREARSGRCSQQVGVRGLEPPAFCSRSRRATRLRYTPMWSAPQARPRSPAVLWPRPVAVKPHSSREPGPRAGRRSRRPGRWPRRPPSRSPARRRRRRRSARRCGPSRPRPPR